MSYILDALKKVEQEKTRKSRAAGKINITGELLGGERSRPVAGRRLKTLIIVSAAVLITFGTSWLLLKEKGELKRPETAFKTAQPTPSVRVVAQTPPAVVPPPVPQAAVAPAPQPVSAPLPALKVAAPVAKRAPVDDDDAPRAPRSRRQPAKPAASQPKATVPAATPGPAPADIKVSGVAWQEERSARRAVVNGFLMKEGSVVSGAKITEILQDRVRFSLSGTTFELTFNSSGAPAAGK